MEIKKYQEISGNFKRTIASRYIAIDKDSINFKIKDADSYLTSVKYDGHFFLLAYEEGKAVLINHKGKVYDDLKILKEAQELLALAGVKQIAIAGELYIAQENSRSRSFHLTSALADRSSDLSFAAFDLCQKESLPVKDLNCFGVYDELKRIFKGGKNLHVAEGEIHNSKKDIQNHFNKKVTEGNQEGLIVKSSDGVIYKVKSKYTLDGVIIGYAEGENERAGMLRDFLIALMKEDGSYQILCKVGTGFTEDERKTLLPQLEKLKTGSNYIEAASSNVAFQMVKPELVLELSCLDIISENGFDNIRKMNLFYNPAQGYTANRNVNSCSLVNPVFLRMRDDKSVNSTDIRFSQVTDIIDITPDEKQESLSKSEIIRRDVYKKESKDQKMVRKFVLWKTNKEASGEYPAFVYHYSDFSPGRKDMLQKDIRVSNSKEQILAIYKAEIEENIKKGWEKVG